MKKPDLLQSWTRLRESIAEQRGEIETLALNGVLIAMIVLLAVAGTRRLEQVQQADRRVQAVHDALKTWPARYQPPSVYERQSWAAAAADIERLGVKSDDRLFLAQLLSRRAENIGVSDARVAFTQAKGGAPRVIGARRFVPASYGANVEFESSFASAVEYVAQLPGAVAINAISLQRGSSGVKALFTLQVYEPAGAVR